MTALNNKSTAAYLNLLIRENRVSVGSVNLSSKQSAINSNKSFWFKKPNFLPNSLTGYIKKGKL